MNIWVLLLFLKEIRTGTGFRITSNARGTHIINQISAVPEDSGERAGNVRERNYSGICGRGCQKKETVGNVIAVLNMITSMQNKDPGADQQTANPTPDTALSVHWRSTDHQRIETTEHPCTRCTTRYSELDPRINCMFKCPGGMWYMRRTEDVPVCYGFFPDDKTTRKKAEMTCVIRGAHLVSIESYEEMMFLENLILETPRLKVTGFMAPAFRGYWTSGKKDDKNSWIWSASKRPIKYFNWQFGQPDGIVGDKYVFMDTEMAKWWDVSELKVAASLCEKQAECLANG